MEMVVSCPSPPELRMATPGAVAASSATLFSSPAKRSASTTVADAVGSCGAGARGSWITCSSSSTGGGTLGSAGQPAPCHGECKEHPARAR